MKDDLLYSINKEKLNLTDLAKGLELRYKKYLSDYKNVKTKNIEREARDKKFLELLAQYKRNEKKSEDEKITAFYEICKFYLDNLNSGFCRRTPEIIRYIRYPLYLAFGLQNLKLNTSYSIYYQPPLIDSNGDAADVIKKRLYQELKLFCKNLEQYKDQEHKFEIE